MSAVLRQLQDDLSDDLDRIKKRFNLPAKVTLVVRSPQLDDGDVVIGDDDLDEAIRAIRRLQDREPVFKP